jgi:hypothetical protein
MQELYNVEIQQASRFIACIEQIPEVFISSNYLEPSIITRVQEFIEPARRLKQKILIFAQTDLPEI